jgi:hypothetical protein
MKSLNEIEAAVRSQALAALDTLDDQVREEIIQELVNSPAIALETQQRLLAVANVLYEMSFKSTTNGDYLREMSNHILKAVAHFNVFIYVHKETMT